MDWLDGKEPCLHSLNFDWNISFRARKVTRDFRETGWAPSGLSGYINFPLPQQLSRHPNPSPGESPTRHLCVNNWFDRFFCWSLPWLRVSLVCVNKKWETWPLFYCFGTDIQQYGHRNIMWKRSTVPVVPLIMLYKAGLTLKSVDKIRKGNQSMNKSYWTVLS